MRTTALLEQIEFHEKNPYAQPLCIDQHGRVLRFALRPGQTIREHNAPNSPFYVVVLQGRGVFAGADERDQEFGAGALLIFDPGEQHSIRALNEELVFLGWSHDAPSQAADRNIGEIARRKRVPTGESPML